MARKPTGGQSRTDGAGSSASTPPLPCLGSEAPTFKSTLVSFFNSFNHYFKKDANINALVDGLYELFTDELTNAVASKLKQTASFEVDLLSTTQASVVEISNKLHAAEASFKEQMDEMEQYGRRNSIRIFGIPETVQGLNAREDTTEAVCQTLTSTLGLSVSPNEIDISHRIGSADGDRPRPIIVKFVRREKRLEVLRNRKKLAGTPVSIDVDLTKERARLLKRAKD